MYVYRHALFGLKWQERPAGCCENCFIAHRLLYSALPWPCAYAIMELVGIARVTGHLTTDGGGNPATGRTFGLHRWLHDEPWPCAGSPPRDAVRATDAGFLARFDLAIFEGFRRPVSHSSNSGSTTSNRRPSDRSDGGLARSFGSRLRVGGTAMPFACRAKRSVAFCSHAQRMPGSASANSSATSMRRCGDSGAVSETTGFGAFGNQKSRTDPAPVRASHVPSVD